MTDAPGGGSGVGPKIEEVSRAALSLLAFDLFIRAKLVIGKDILDKFYFYAFWLLVLTIEVSKLSSWIYIYIFGVIE